MCENLSAVITSHELSQVMYRIQEPESSPNPTALVRITQRLMRVKTMHSDPVVWFMGDIKLQIVRYCLIFSFIWYTQYSLSFAIITCRFSYLRWIATPLTYCDFFRGVRLVNTWLKFRFPSWSFIFCLPHQLSFFAHDFWSLFCRSWLSALEPQDRSIIFSDFWNC
jgi:hypothetical protein